MTKATSPAAPDLQAKDTKPATGRYRPGSRAGAGGRPSSYTEAKGLIICARMADGENLTQICRDKDQPARGTVTKWLLAFPEFAAIYALARDALLDTYADEIINIGDDGTTDYVLKTGRNGHEYMAVDQEHIQRSRLRCDNRRWLLSKLRPAQYGDRITAEVGGKVTVMHDISSLSERERMRRLALFMAEDQAQPALEGQAVRLPGDDDKDSQPAAAIDKNSPP